MRPVRWLCCSTAVAQQLYRQYCTSVWLKRLFFSHFYSLAAESISKRQVAEALHKPTQLLCDVPTQTCIGTLRKKTKKNKPCETDFYVNNSKCIFPLKKHSYFHNFYFISRYQINHLVKLIRTHTRGNAVLDALMLCVLINMHETVMCNMYRGLVLTNTHCLSIACAPHLYRKGQNSSHPHTDARI